MNYELVNINFDVIKDFYHNKLPQERQKYITIVKRSSEPNNISYAGIINKATLELVAVCSVREEKNKNLWVEFLMSIESGAGSALINEIEKRMYEFIDINSKNVVRLRLSCIGRDLLEYYKALGFKVTLIQSCDVDGFEDNPHEQYIELIKELRKK